MTEAESLEFLKGYRRWRRRRWLRLDWWRRRTRDKASFFECSFCKNHIPKNRPKHGVLGLDSYICPDCVVLCAQIVAEQDFGWRDRLIDAVHMAESDKSKS